MRRKRSTKASPTRKGADDEWNVDGERLDLVQEKQWKLVWNYFDKQYEVYDSDGGLIGHGKEIRDAIDTSGQGQ